MDRDLKNLQEENTQLRLKVERLEKALLMAGPFANVFDSVPMPVLIKDENLTWLHGNKALCTMLGCEPADIAGATEHDFHSPEEAEQIHHYDRLALKTGIQQQFECDIELDGRKHYLTSLKVRWTDPEGRVFVVTVVRDVTAVHRARQAMTESRERFEAFFQNTPLGIFILRVEEDSLILEDANPEAERITARDLSQDYGTSIANIFPHMAESRITRSLLSVAKTGKPWKGQRPYSGERLGTGTFHLQAFPISPGRIAVQVKDITERVIAKRALQQSEEQLRLVLQATKDGFWDWDIPSGKAMLSPSFYTMLGYRPGEFESSSEGWRQLLHPDDLEMVQRETQRSIDRGTEFRHEFRVKSKTGRWVWILSRGRVVEFDVKGNALRMVGTHTDISDFKKVQETLAEFTNLFGAMSDNMIDMLWAKDKDSRFIFANKATQERLLHCEGLDPIGRDDKFFAVKERERGYTHTFGEQCIDSDKVVLDTRQPGRFIEDGMIRNRYTVLDVRKSPLYDSNGEFIGTVGTGRDITEQKMAEEALVEAKDAAETAARSKDQFLANMSHEVRTPMNGMLGMMQLLKTTPLDGEQTEYVDTSLESGRGLLSVINDILDFSKMSDQGFELMEQEFDLRATLKTVLRNFSVQAQDKRVGVAFEVDPDCPTMLVGDDARLRQILFNLVGNALKFTHSGMIRVQVDLLHDRGDHVLAGFEVSDTGIGIPDKLHDSIFAPFTQADNSLSKAYQGTGLGLGIVKSLVEKMGGTVTLDSTEGTGTTIYFTIRLGKTESEAPGRETTPETNSDRQTLLVAEDDSVNRFTLKRYLEKLGYSVITAVDGREAVELAKKHQPVLILMDVQMPVMDGVEATRELRRATGPERNIPIIALTAYAMQGDREEFMDSGMDAYVSKPLELDDLEQALLRFLPAS